MDWKHTIDRTKDVPVYRQIIEGITRQVQNQTLAPGDKLPTERELAEYLSVARGTVTKAYEELERDGIIQIIQGSGSYINREGEENPVSRKERAMILINNLIQSMIEMNFSLQEIRNFVSVKILEKENQLRQFNLAGIDCNPEAMAIYENQLLYVSRSWMHKFLLNDLKEHASPQSLLRDFDLILTTTTHYREILQLVPELKNKVFQAAVAPSPDTIASLATLGRKSRIGILTHSSRFGEIIEQKLKELQLESNIIRRGLFGNEPDLLEFLMDIDGVIIPPATNLEDLPNSRIALPRFKEAGGWFLEFSHQIERGSLIYLEERIAALLTE